MAYAAIARWDPTGPDRRMAVLAAMHAVGRAVLEAAGGTPYDG